MLFHRKGLNLVSVTRLIALKYFSPQLQAGGVYETTDPKAADMLVAAGLMRRADETAAPVPPADTTEPVDQTQKPAPRRATTYRTRQLTAGADA